MSIQGSLDSISLMELFSSLLQWNKTGVLTVLNKVEERSFLFYGGNLVYATSRDSARRLGSFLVRLGYVSAEELQSSLTAAPGGQGQLGQRLLSEGKITPKQLRTAVRAQLFDIFLEVMSWDHAAFIFDDSELPFTVSESIVNSTQSLLLEAATRIDETLFAAESLRKGTERPCVDLTARSSDRTRVRELPVPSPAEPIEKSGIRPELPWCTVAPDTPSKILALERGDRDQFATMCSVVGSEPMVAAKLFRFLNLVNVQLGREELSVAAFVKRVGSFNVRCVVLSEAVRRLYFPPGEAFWRECWEHDRICAHLCEAISHRIRYRYPGEAYMAGLLHNIGVYILYVHDPTGYKALVTESVISECDCGKLEKERYQTTHAEVGAAYARRWRFPPAVQMAIKDHHRIGRTISRPLLHILNAANEVLDEYGYRLGYHDHGPITLRESLGTLGLSQEDLLALFIEARQKACFPHKECESDVPYSSNTGVPYGTEGVRTSASEAAVTRKEPS